MSIPKYLTFTVWVHYFVLCTYRVVLAILLFTTLWLLVDLFITSQRHTVILTESVTLRLANEYGIMDDHSTTVYPAGMDFKLSKGAKVRITQGRGTNVLITYLGRGPGTSVPHGAQFIISKDLLDAVSSSEK